MGITRPTVTGATGSLTRNTRCRASIARTRSRFRWPRHASCSRRLASWSRELRRGEFVSLTADADRERFAGHRADLNASRRGFHDIVAGERLRLALDAFVPFAHWVTPPIDVKRFDTRFFATRIPPHQTPVHDAHEATESLWIAPRLAIAAATRDELLLPPPTWATLRELERFDSVEAALSWAATHRIERREPVVTLENGVRKIVLARRPDDPRTRTGRVRNAIRDGRWTLAAGARRMSNPSPQLSRALGFRDLLAFYIVTTFSLRWMATAAAAGPSALVIWIIAAVGLFVPLVFATLELSSRYPDEGGMYVWSKRAFGPFSGFMTGWSYWTTNLPYFPSLLYLAAANLLFLGGPSWQAWSSNSTYFMVTAVIGLTLAVSLNIIGLEKGKWLNNAGAAAAWISAGLLIVLGIVSWFRFGSATTIDAHTIVPSVSLKDVIFWSTIAFAFGGVESASTMGEEIKDAQRTMPRAVVAAAIVITALYLAGTLSVLLAIPKEQISGLQGIMQAIDRR